MHPRLAALHRLGGYSFALAAVGGAVLATFALRPWMGTSVSILFFPAVIWTAMHGGYGPSLVATLLSSIALAHFFVPPLDSFDIGADDGIRLLVFAAVAVVTASLAEAQKRAERAQRRALEESREALNTLRKVSGWPVFVDTTLGGAARRLLEHAANVAGATGVVAVWEAEDEPWVYVADPADTNDGVRKHAPTEMDAVVDGLRRKGFVPAGFSVEHLAGQLFFAGIAAGPGTEPLMDVVAREVGNSIERLHLHDRLQQIAIREDRIRVARDLHDGVLQSLTGIRFRLQALADEPEAPGRVRERLLAVERAIGTEQRELRRFIEDLRPAARRTAGVGRVAELLDDLRGRLVAEWNTPIAVRVTPAELSVDESVEQALRFTVREAVVNALKHAHPSRVSVDVVQDAPRWLHVAVANDGRGFPFRGRLDHAELVASQAGPASLRERLDALGGRLTIESTATGSRVEMAIPLAEAAVR